MIFIYLFITFFQIGLFGFGGGYGMLSLIQTEVVHNHHWLTTEQFTNIVAISQMTPGPIGINSATYCGYTAVHNSGYGYAMSMLGSFTATFALVLPSFILMILISKMFLKYMKTHAVQSVFNRPFGCSYTPANDSREFQSALSQSLAVLHQLRSLCRHLLRHVFP